MLPSLLLVFGVGYKFKSVRTVQVADKARELARYRRFRFVPQAKLLPRRGALALLEQAKKSPPWNSSPDIFAGIEANSARMTRLKMS